MRTQIPPDQATPVRPNLPAVLGLGFRGTISIGIEAAGVYSGTPAPLADDRKHAADNEPLLQSGGFRA